MNWKIHIPVIAGMTVILSTMYFVLKPSQAEIKTVVSDLGDVYIRIDQAHWGYNCNAQYRSYMRRARLGTNGDKAATTGTTGNAPAKPQPVLQNNVLSLVGKLCDVKTECKFTADSLTLGNPYANCFKELDIRWRCFSYDRLHSATISEGEPVEISCAKADAGTSAAN